MEMSKYVKSEPMELRRSEISPAGYNPREMGEEEKKNLKRIIRKFGLVGGITVNRRTGMTIVGGHQRIAAMDELQKYDPKTKKNDYRIRVDVIDVDEKKEKELNIALNNPNAQGTWNRDKLAALIPEIDYKDVGLTEADLSLCGCDYLFQTVEETALADSLTDLMQPIEDEHERELAAKQAEREAKIAHMKDVKQQVKESSNGTANDMDAYVMLSFDSQRNKERFMSRFGYSPYDKYIKGEDFDMKCEAVLDD